MRSPDTPTSVQFNEREDLDETGHPLFVQLSELYAQARKLEKAVKTKGWSKAIGTYWSSKWDVYRALVDSLAYRLLDEGYNRSALKLKDALKPIGHIYAALKDAANGDRPPETYNNHVENLRKSIEDAIVGVHG